MLFRLLDDEADEDARGPQGGLLDFEESDAYGGAGRSPAGALGGLMNSLVAAPRDPHDPLWSIARYGLPPPPFGAMGPMLGLPYPIGASRQPSYPPVTLGNLVAWPTAPWLFAERTVGNDQTGWSNLFRLGVPNHLLSVRPPAARGLLSLLDENDNSDGSAMPTTRAFPGPTTDDGPEPLGQDEAFGRPQGPSQPSGLSNTVLAQVGGAADWPQMPITPGQDTIPDDIEREFRGLARYGRSLGLIEAPGDLEHFLGGSGEPRIIPRDRARQFGPILDAQNVNEGRHEAALVDPARFAPALLNLQDGQTIVFKDNFDRAYGDRDFIRQLRDPETRDFALAFGNTQLKSEGDFAATRVGDEIHIEGTVDHQWNDDYNFHPERYFGFGGIKANDAAILEGHGRAKPFARKSSWPRRVKGKIRIESGALKDPVFEWEDIDQ